jgi:hypothetical protein
MFDEQTVFLHFLHVVHICKDVILGRCLGRSSAPETLIIKNGYIQLETLTHQARHVFILNV